MVLPPEVYKSLNSDSTNFFPLIHKIIIILYFGQVPRVVHNQSIKMVINDQLNYFLISCVNLSIHERIIDKI